MHVDRGAERLRSALVEHPLHLSLGQHECALDRGEEDVGAAGLVVARWDQDHPILPTLRSEVQDRATANRKPHTVLCAGLSIANSTVYPEETADRNTHTLYCIWLVKERTRVRGDLGRKRGH